MASRPPLDRLIDPQVLDVPVLRFSPDQLLARDLRVARIGQSPPVPGARGFPIPARSADQAIAILDQHRQAFEKAANRFTEISMGAAGAMTDEFARLSEHANDTVRKIVEKFIRNPDDAAMLDELKTLRTEVVGQAKRVTLPMQWLEVQEATDEIIAAAAEAGGELKGALVDRSAGRAQQLERISARLRDRSVNWLRIGEDRLLMLKGTAAALEHLGNFVGVIPIAKATSRLLSAEGEAAFLAALREVAREVAKFGIGKVFGAATAMLAIMFVPTSLGFFGVVGCAVAGAAVSWALAEATAIRLGFNDPAEGPRIEHR